MSNNDALAQALRAVADQLAVGNNQSVGFKHTPGVVASHPPYAHSVGGLFNIPGADNRVFGTIMRPGAFAANRFPVMPAGSSYDARGSGITPNAVDVPLFNTITGVTAGDVEALANQRENPCDEPPEAGLLKNGTLTAHYGRFSVKTRPYDIRSNFRAQNLADPYWLQNMNTGMDDLRFTAPTANVASGNSIMQSELNKRIFEAMVGIQRRIAPLFWTGTPANNTAGGGYAEFEGMNILINAGNKFDVNQGMNLPSLDSYMRNFGFNLINNSAAALPDIVNEMDHIYFTLNYRARHMNLDPASWVIVMRPELFDEIVKVWPVRYYQEALLAIEAFTNGRVTLDARDTTNMRDAMREGMFLPIRGKAMEVITDDAIPEDSLQNQGEAEVGGSWYSDIYFIPEFVMGQVPVTYWEAASYNTSVARDHLNPQEALTWWVTDGGVWLWTLSEQRGCRSYTMECAPRIILRTPQLAARLQNVAYAPLDHQRTAYPSGDGSIGTYFVDGGATNTPIGTIYTQYGGDTPVALPINR